MTDLCFCTIGELFLSINGTVQVLKVFILKNFCFDQVRSHNTVHIVLQSSFLNETWYRPCAAAVHLVVTSRLEFY